MAIKEFFARAWAWVTAVSDKYDIEVEKVAEYLLPLVVEIANKKELSGDEKRKLVLDTIITDTVAASKNISLSMVNHAIEVATNKLNIQLGKTTVEQIDNTVTAIIDAAAKHAKGASIKPGEEVPKPSVPLSSSQDL